MISFYAPPYSRAPRRRRHLPPVTRWVDAVRTFFLSPWVHDVDGVPVPCAPGWDAHIALFMATAAAKQGAWELVEAELLRGGDVALNDAACLNLLGLAAEVRGDWPRAKRLYGRALRRDRGYLPAELNMRRYFELFTFGRSTVPKCLVMSWPVRRVPAVAPAGESHHDH